MARGLIAVALVFLASTLAHFALLLCLRRFCGGGERRNWLLAFLTSAHSLRDLLSSAALFSVADLPLVLLTLSRLAGVVR